MKHIEGFESFRWGVGFFLLSFFFFLTPEAAATIENRNLLPFGERELLTANAGVAGEASTGSVYYNPGALAQIDHARIAVSGSTYVSSSTETPKILRIDDTDIPYTQSGFDTVPSTLISTFHRSDWTFAYFLLVPETAKLSNKFTIETTNTESTLIQSRDSQELWLGTTASRYVSKSTALGISIQGIWRTQRESVGEITSFESPANTGVVTNSYQNLSAYSLSATLGALHHVNDVVTLGFRLQTPSLRIGGTGEAYQGTQTTEGGTLTTTNDSAEDIPAKYTFPLDMTVGSRFKLGSAMTYLLDVSYQLGADFDILDNPDFASKVRTQPTTRMSTGLLYRTSERFEVGVGFTYNPSAIHDLSGYTAGTPRVNAYGFTLGTYWTVDNVRTGLSIFHIRGEGQVVPGPEIATPASLTARATGAALTIGYLL